MPTAQAQRQAVPPATIRVDVTGLPQVVAADAAVEALLGFTAADLLAGRVALRDCIHAHDHDIADELFNAASSRQSGTCSLRLRMANQRIRCVRCQFSKSRSDGDARGA